MVIKIHKILKDDLSYDSGINISSAGMSRSTGMTISHFACSSKSTEATIPYEIEAIEQRASYIPPLEFSMVARKKVDLTAVGANEKIITDIEKDVGEYDYADKVPNAPKDLPPGFVEVYKKD